MSTLGFYNKWKNFLSEAPTLKREARRSDKEGVPRVDQIEVLGRYADQDHFNPEYFVTFHNVNKIGINPGTEFNTPVGIYAYPVDRELLMQMETGTVPFASNAEYITLFKVVDGANALDISASTSIDFLQLLFSNETVAEFGLAGTDFGKEVEQISEKARELEQQGEKYPVYTAISRYGLSPTYDNALKKRKRKNDFALIWLLTKNIAQNPAKWNGLLRHLGFDYAYDSNSGIIHRNEKRQAVFFSRSSLDIVETMPNNYKKDKVRAKQRAQGIYVEGDLMEINKEIEEYFKLNLLLEARVKDIKAKYKTLDEAGWIEWARRQIEHTLGPKGVSKYLLFWARTMQEQFKGELEEKNPEKIKNDSDFLEIGNLMLDLILKFQQNQQRMEEKDIYKYSASTLQMALDALGLSSRQKRDKEKEEAIEGAEVVYDEDDMFAVRPYDENASCYYGKNTRWCISATSSRNYFQQYSEDGKAFVMVRMNNLEEDDDDKKVALVYDIEGSFEEAYDARDQQMGYIEVRDAIARNFSAKLPDYPEEGLPYNALGEEMQEKVDSINDDLFTAASDNVMINPPDPTAGFEEEIERLEGEYNDRIQHAYYSAEVDNYGEGNYMYFSGGFSIEVSESKLEPGDYPFPEGWREQRPIMREIEDLLNSQLSVYPEEVDIQSGYPDGIEFRISISTNDFEPNPDGYDNFLSELVEYDDKYPAMVRLIEKYLAEQGYISFSEFDRFASEDLEDLGASLSNFKYHVEEDVGDETIAFESSVMETPDSMEMRPQQTVKMFPDLERHKQFVHNQVHGYKKFKSKMLTDRVVARLKVLHQKIVKYLEKQLELPISDLPPRVVRELSIPEIFKVVLLVPATDNNIGNLKFFVDLEIDDVGVTPTVIGAVKEIIKFMDSNFLSIKGAIQDTIRELYEDMIKDAERRYGRLSDSTRQLISLGYKHANRDRRLQHSLRFVEDWKRSAVTDEALVTALTSLQADLKAIGVIPDDFPVFSANTLQEAHSLQSEIEQYLGEEKGRSRQRGIYKFYCMVGYTIDIGDVQRGLDDILADIRAIPNVTIVTVVVSNRKITENRYIAGLSVKFIPSYPGVYRGPEDTKSRLLRDIRRIKNIERIFKVSPSVERIE